MAYPITGPDVSFWQDNNETLARIDWQQCKDAGASFAIVKCGQGNWLDGDFTYNYRGSMRVGLPTLPYWFLDWRFAPTLQAEMFASAVEAIAQPVSFVIDYEQRAYRPGTRAACLDFLTRTVTRLAELVERQIIIYTAPAFWLEVGSPDPYWSQYPLWIAHYGVDRPTIPAPWRTWLFWQYTTLADGPAYGMESRGLDMNRYNGTREQWDAYLAAVNGGNGENSGVIKTVATQALPMRSAPGTSNPTIAQMQYGAQVRCTAEEGAYTKIEGWVASQYLR